MKHRAWIVLALGWLVVGSSCGGKDPGGGARIALSGRFPAPAARAGGVPAGAAALEAPVPVDGIIAATVVTRNGGAMVDISKGTVDANGFNLRLETGHTYAVFLMHGVELVAVLRADAAGSGMTVFPVAVGAQDVDLGTVTIASGEATGTLSSAALYQGLRITGDLAATLATRDAAMLRYATVDVDGNGVADFDEDQNFGLGFGWAVSAYSQGAALSGSDWLPLDGFKVDGYRPMFHALRDVPALPWASATLTLPAPVDYWSSAVNQLPHWTTGVTELPAVSTSAPPGGDRGLDFFGSEGFVSTSLPSGTWIVTVGSQQFTFHDVGVAYDLAAPGHLVPDVRLVRAGSAGPVTRVEWRWYVTAEGGARVLATDADLAATVIQAQLNLGGTSGTSTGWVASQLIDVNGAAQGAADVVGAPASLQTVEIGVSNLFDGSARFVWTIMGDREPAR
jgi:hypothetical protein